MQILAVISTLFVLTLVWPYIVGIVSVVSILFSNGNLTVVSTVFLTFHCKQSIRCFNSFVKRKISPFFQEFFGLRLQAIYSLFQFFSLMGNLTFVLIIFWPYIVSNLSVVSILLSNGKSKCCFISFLAMHCRQSFRPFNSFLK